uniref:ARAD1D20218p n=1 Tax=Blastobotrys adeninivorans TaxID=409370 RepID=A0A060T9P4_BLAAD
MALYQAIARPHLIQFHVHSTLKDYAARAALSEAPKFHVLDIIEIVERLHLSIMIRAPVNKCPSRALRWSLLYRRISSRSVPTKATGVSDQQRVDSFKDIVKDMNQRLRTKNNLTAPADIEKADRRVRLKLQISTSYDHVQSQVSPGSIIQTSGEILVVVSREATKSTLVCVDELGAIKEVNGGEIMLQFGQSELAMPEDPVRTIPPDVYGEEMLMLSSDARKMATTAIRSIRLGAAKNSQEINRVISSIFSHLASMDRSVNIPLFELAQWVEFFINEPESTIKKYCHSYIGRDDIPFLPSHVIHKFSSQMVDSSILHQVFMMINHVYYLQATINRDLCITVYNSHDQALRKEQKSIRDADEDTAQKYIKRYGLKDLSKRDRFAQAQAITLLRTLDPQLVDRIKSLPYNIDPGSALAYLGSKKAVNEEDGPRFDSETLAFARQPSQINSVERQDYGDFVDSVRTDYDSPVFCIDDSTAKEIDDGVSLDFKEGGDIVTVGVHIADPVSALLKAESSGDNELKSLIPHAIRAASTVYLPTRTIPLLPSSFTEQFGLLDSTKRRSLSVFFDFDLQKGVIDQSSVQVKALMLSNIRQVTYDQVDDILSNKQQSEHTRLLSTLSSVAEKSRKIRVNRGGLKFTNNKRLPVVSCTPDAQGVPQYTVTMTEERSTPAHNLVEEFMILGNHLTAQYLTENRIPGIYRAQTISKEDGLLVKELATKDARAAASLLKPAFLTASSNFPHHPLGISQYTQMTSPLRRSTDILAHWQLECHLAKADNLMLWDAQMSVLAGRMQASQRLIRRAVAESQYYWALRYFQNALRNGQQPSTLRVIVTHIYDYFSSKPTRAYFADLNIEAEVYGVPPTTEVGAAIDCSIIEVDPTAYRLALKYESTN